LTIRLEYKLELTFWTWFV